MNAFFLIVAGFVLLTVAVGLIRILLGPQNEDRMMSAQLLGTGGVAVMLLAAGGGVTAAIDVALAFALLAAFAAVAFVRSENRRK